jgi:hypothetical protein
MGLEVANETANSVFTSAFTKKGYAEKVIDPEASLSTLNTKPEVAEAVSQLRT